MPNITRQINSDGVANEDGNPLSNGRLNPDTPHTGLASDPNINLVSVKTS